MSRRREKLPQNEWTYALELDKVDDSGQEISIEAPEGSKPLLERRLDISGLDELKADLRIEPQAGGVFHVLGRMHAKIIQLCVVTAEPIESLIEEEVEGWFIDHEAGVTSFAKAQKDRVAGASKGHAEVEVMDESEDPEPAVGGQIDLGEFIVQNLSLAINPYPHKEGAHYEYTDAESQDSKRSGARKSPFEALKDWKENR